MMIHLQHVLYLHWLLFLSNNQGLDFKCLLIWGVLFEMSELRHWGFFFPIEEKHWQLCQGSVQLVESKCTCRLSCTCLVGQRETEVLAGKALEGKGSHCFVTAACLFFSWDERWEPQSLTASQKYQRITVETTQAPAVSVHWDEQAGQTRLHLCTLLTVIP